MSNYLSIATITATLQRILQASIQADVEGAKVTTLRPDRIGNGTPDAGLNLYLYEVGLNSAWRSTDLRNRHTVDKYTKRAQTGLDLCYLFSAYGNDAELEPQRLMGSVFRTLSNKSVISQEMIRDTVADSNFSFLANSNLAEQVEVIAIYPLDLETEEISKVWNVFFRTPHLLTVAYRTSVVIIDGENLTTQKPLPVRQFRPDITPNQPAILQIIVQDALAAQMSQKAAPQFILATSTLLIKGNRLGADAAEVNIGNVKFTPKLVSETSILLELSSKPATSLSAGVQSLQVIHPKESVRSNIMPIVIRPTIHGVNLSNVQTKGGVISSAHITVQVDLTIHPTQSVTLLLTKHSLTEFTGYTFDTTVARNSSSNCITFEISDCLPGTYLVRIVVDGAESLLTVDTNSNSPTFEQYIGPLVVIIGNG